MAGLSVRRLHLQGRPPRRFTWTAVNQLSEAAYQERVRPALVNWMEVAVRRLLERGDLVEVRRGGVRHIEPAGQTHE